MSFGVPSRFSRRNFMAAAVVAAALPVVACSREQKHADGGQGSPKAMPTLAMLVHKDPGCPCCEGWAHLAAAAGFTPTVVEEPDMPALKGRLGVPLALSSCHTAELAGYVFEGHVPIEHMQRLIASKDQRIKGLAVAGMPLGSPGMEAPNGAKANYDVIAFDGHGKTSVYAKV
jgi:hypothetical protein